MFTVVDDMVVSLDYTLSLEDGQVVDSSEGQEPLEFVQGHGAIIAGLEKALYGMIVGEEKAVVVEPEDGYGEFDSDLFETLPRTVFPADMVLEQGMAFRMRTDTGEVVLALVDHMEDDHVVVNLNHPLAGKKLLFSVKVVDLREATPEELEGGCESCGGCSSCGDGCDCDDEGEGCCSN
jgi:FKBP-type peptidyl-prolyl cis-trans isomerase SlyD